MPVKTIDWDFELHYRRKVAPLVPDAPWMLRVTDLSDKPSPVFVIKQRRTVPLEPSRNGQGKKSKRSAQNQGSLFGDSAAEKVILQERGLIYGESQRRCLPVLREIVSRVQDDHQAGLELQRLLPLDRIQFRGNLPLDDESGCKLTLIFKLQERVKELTALHKSARFTTRSRRMGCIDVHYTQARPAADEGIWNGDIRGSPLVDRHKITFVFHK